MAQIYPTPTADQPTRRDTLTLYELSARMGVSYSTVYELARTDTLPVPVIRVGRRYLVSRRAYEAVMDARHEPECQRGA